MKRTVLIASVLLLGSVSTMTAQVKLQANNVDEVLKAMTLEEKAMLVVGGNRQIATGDNNGMIGRHAQRVPGAAGATASYNLSRQHAVKCHDVMKPSMPL